jgi:hypothetical protein
MKFCYIDESGYGDEPIIVMAGIVVDAFRMHITKGHWDHLLNILSIRAGRPVIEFKTRLFYRGAGIWNDLNGDERSTVIQEIISWLRERKHNVAFTAIDKKKLRSLPRNCRPEGFPDQCPSPWVLAAFHLLLGIQKQHQGSKATKGHTVCIFDKEFTEERGLVALVRDPPAWSDTFYSASPRSRLDQIVDVPYFADSRDVGLLQVADLFAYLLRNYAELESGYREPKYHGESAKLKGWAQQVVSIALPQMTRWPRKSVCPCAALFNAVAPEPLERLG